MKLPKKIYFQCLAKNDETLRTTQDDKLTWELDPQAKELCILDISVLFHACTLICH
jgi:hypothetical protein